MSIKDILERDGMLIPHRIYQLRHILAEDSPMMLWQNIRDLMLGLSSTALSNSKLRSISESLSSLLENLSLMR